MNRPTFTGSIKKGDWVVWWNEVDKKQMSGIVQEVDPVFAVIDVAEDDNELIETIKESLDSQEAIEKVAGDEVMYWAATILTADGRYYSIDVKDLAEESQ